MLRSFSKMFLAKGRWKVTISTIVILAIYNKYYPGNLDLGVRYVWKEFFAPLASMLFICLVMLFVLKGMWNALMGKKKWF